RGSPHDPHRSAGPAGPLPPIPGRIAGTVNREGGSWSVDGSVAARVRAIRSRRGATPAGPAGLGPSRGDSRRGGRPIIGAESGDFARFGVVDEWHLDKRKMLSCLALSRLRGRLPKTLLQLSIGS